MGQAETTSVGKIVDDVFEWQGFGNNFGTWESRCRVRVYDHAPFTVILTTELSENDGTPVHQCVENLAILIINKYNLDLKKIVLIEHNAQQDRRPLAGNWSTREESFELVSFEVTQSPNPLDPKRMRVQFVNPRWKPLRREHVESLCGEAV